MKQTKHLLTVLFLGAMTLMTSCTEKKPEIPDEPTNNIEEVRTELKMELTEDFFAMMEVEVRFIDNENKVATEKLSSRTWSRTITNNKFDVYSGLMVLYTPKKNTKIDDAKIYQMGSKISAIAYTLKGGNVIGVKEGINTSSTIAVKGDKLPEYLKRHNGPKQYLSLKISKDGSMSEATIDWGVNFI